MNSRFPERVAILAPGLLGGSLLRALRERCEGIHLRVWARREEAAQQVGKAGIADLATTDLNEAVSGADFIVLCMPVEHMAAIARQLVKAPVSPGCVVTDVGSVKTSVVFALEQIFAASPLHFLGSHPMAGSEKAGFEVSRADLFEGASCLLTPTLLTDASALQVTRAVWEKVGCHLREISPEDHDRIVARVSHMPHLAAAVVTLAALHDHKDAASCIGNGFRDTTRVAAGDPELWRGIVAENRAEVLAALTEARDRFNELLAMLEKMDDKALRHFLHEAQLLRQSVPASP
ncbi:prephenate dehydrogenase [Roseimicrobium gellanilyticum]|uniref:prephenate dehydrogenase n=1 Tax=Roseimicrobium gellanilyticum TaxID=748857 RepID=UPI0014736310|nr:prephenate dehydrogenase/arogenate dehydrogenase family protein [Roseimicrobium gellanilyticum]